jgi:hypothetical protein
MTIKLNRIVILLLLVMTFIYGDCSKNKGCLGANETYSFSVNVHAFPDADSVSINDTIWLEINFPVNLVDLNTQTTVNFSNAKNLGTDITFHRFIGGSFSDPGVFPGANDFEYKLIHGTFVPDSHLPDQNKDYLFSESGSMYKFKLGIIPKRQGIFGISPGNVANVYRNDQKCEKAGFQITFSNTNQHLYFYEQNRPGYTLSNYESTHVYCFKVK